MAAESGEDGVHPELPFALDNLLLERFLAVYPALRQGAVYAVDVAHPVPWEMCWPGEPGAYLLVTQAVLPPDFLPDGILPGYRQGKVDALQCHPVYEPLPVFPFPPWHCVTEGAVVEEKALRHERARTYRYGRQGHFCRKLQPVHTLPGDIGLAIVAKVASQAGGKGVCAAAVDVQFAALGVQNVFVDGVCLVDEHYPGCILRHNAPCQLSGGPLLRVLAPKRQHQHCQAKTQTLDTHFLT